MRPPHHILDRQTVYRLAAEHLQSHLQFLRLQEEDLGPGPLVVVAGRRGPHHLACRRLPAPRRRPIRRHAATALLATLPDFAELQRRLNRALAGDPPKAFAEASSWPSTCSDPLPRPAVARPRRDLPQPGQERHQPLPRLRHRLRHPQRAPFTVALTASRKASPRATSSNACCAKRPGRRPSASSLAGSRLLQRGRVRYLQAVAARS